MVLNHSEFAALTYSRSINEKVTFARDLVSADDAGPQTRAGDHTWGHYQRWWHHHHIRYLMVGGGERAGRGPWRKWKMIMILWLWWQPGVRWQLWHEHGASINIPSSNIFMAQFWLDQCLVFTSPKARQKVRHYVLITPLTAAPASACCRDCWSCQTVQSPSISMKRQLLCKNILFCDKTWIRGL